VQSTAEAHAEWTDRFADSAGAADRPGRTIERGEKPVARRIDLPAAKTLELLAHEDVMLGEDLAPPPVAQGRRLLGGTDDVGEEDRGEYAGRLGDVSDAGQEFLELTQDGLRVATPRQVVDAREFHVPGTVDMLGEVATEADIDRPVAAAVQHEGRHPNRRQDVAHVDLVVHSDHRQGRRWTRARAEVPRPPTSGALVAGKRRSPLIECDGPAPLPLAPFEPQIGRAHV